MAKTEKELAFLRDLYIQDEWTKRFTDLVDKNMDLSDSENMLYINAGTGHHAMAVCERFGEKTDIFATCENVEMLTIAQDKAAAVKSPVDFSMIRFEDDSFDAVLADASFVRPGQVEDFIQNTIRVARTGGDIAVFMPSAGSYGEIFSLLWEELYNEELPEGSEMVTRLIEEIPTVSRIEKIAEESGMVNINTQVAIEQFEYENGKEFVESPLVADFLMPVWLESLEDEEKEKVQAGLARLIDDEDGSLTFRFSVKATLLTGEKD
jgi:ubiquinone/menaquinone biosynthesis C-methylase UbiE